MFKLSLSPKAPFSFNHLSYGYNFEPLISNPNGTYSGVSSIYSDSKEYFCSYILSRNSDLADRSPISVSFNIYTQNSTNKLIQIVDQDSRLTKLVKRNLSFYVGTEEDYSKFYTFLEDIEEVREYIDFLPGYRLSGISSTTWMPIFAYLTTNTTVKMYHEFVADLRTQYGLKLPKRNILNYTLPPINTLKTLSENQFRKLRLGFRSKYLPKMVESLSNGLDIWQNSQDSSVKLKKLKQIKGIGDYTARTTLLYGLRDYSIPFVDSFVKILMKEYFEIGKSLSNKKIQQFITQKFHPYQGLLIDWLTGVHKFRLEHKL